MNTKTRISSAAAASIFALSLGTIAFAQTTDTGSVSQEVLPGAVTFAIEDGTLDPVTYAAEDTTGEGDLTLTVNGNGNLEGWALTVEATGDFVYGGTSAGGSNIAAANLSLVSADAPTTVAGQATGPVAGTATNASLGDPVPVLSSPANNGSGSYEQNLNVSLLVPAYSQVGTYTGVVTVAMAAAPGNEPEI